MEQGKAAPENQQWAVSRMVAGRRLAYYDRGSGPALVLVHGMFGDHMDWAPVLEPLPAHYRVIAVDLPGFGDSERVEGECTPQRFVDALEEFFADLGLSQITLVGNSFGGMISTFYAAAHPERLRRLALVSSACMKEYTAEERALVAEHFSLQNLTQLRPSYIDPMFSINFARRTPQREAYMERQRGKLQRPDYAAYAQVLTECAQLAFAYPVVPMLEQMPLPKLLVWGDADQVFPIELARAALPKLPQAELAVITGASHMPQMDQPEQFVTALVR